MEILEERVRTPAKVNLYLRVLGRRMDGYHFIDSLMVPISLCDDMQIRLGRARIGHGTPTITVTAGSADVPDGPPNLAYRAAQLFSSAVNTPLVVDIRIHKQIPVGSGLGGGSSDAAAVLLALNRLLGVRLHTGQLAEMGGKIGADVAFFVHGRPARVGGRGDEVTPVPFGTRLNLVVCWDRYPLSTRLVYSRLGRSLTRRQPLSNITRLVTGRQPFTDLLVNDLEAAAAQIHPEVLSLKARIVELGARGALMTGSGSAVFGLWPDGQSARHAALRLRQQGLWAEAVETLDVSPAVGS